MSNVTYVEKRKFEQFLRMSAAMSPTFHLSSKSRCLCRRSTIGFKPVLPFEYVDIYLSRLGRL